MITGKEPANPYSPQKPMNAVEEHGYTGLTIRQHFASMAMQGLISADAKYGGKTNNYKALAEDAVAHADALITELNRTEK